MRASENTALTLSKQCLLHSEHVHLSGGVPSYLAFPVIYFIQQISVPGTVKQGSPTPRPQNSISPQEQSCRAGGEWLASEQTFICIYSCSPLLTLPPELYLLSDRRRH